MAEFCLDCWNKIDQRDDPASKYIISDELDLCEGCGEAKRVIVRDDIGMKNGSDDGGISIKNGSWQKFSWGLQKPKQKTTCQQLFCNMIAKPPFGARLGTIYQFPI